MWVPISCGESLNPLSITIATQRVWNRVPPTGEAVVSCSSLFKSNLKGLRINANSGMPPRVAVADYDEKRMTCAMAWLRAIRWEEIIVENSRSTTIALLRKLRFNRLGEADFLLRWA